MSRKRWKKSPSVPVERLPNAFGLITSNNVSRIDGLDAVINHLRHSKKLRDVDLATIARAAKHARAYQLPQLYTALEKHARSNLLKAQLQEVFSAEVKRRKVARDRWKVINRNNREKKSIKHLQEILFDEIIKDPLPFICETQDQIQERAERIADVIENLDESPKRYALFNLQFFTALAAHEPDVSPIPLPDDEMQYFHWPTTEIVRSARAGTNIEIEAEETGLLSEIGYNVRKDGPSTHSRERILTKFFIGEISVPESISDQYAKEWGAPSTANRLKKMSYSIASFCRQQKRKSNASEQAITKWEGDLEYLRRRFYEPFRRKFVWPSY